MKKITKKKEKKFEESYYKGWYKQAVGSFSQKDLQLANNWFWAWLKKLDQYIPVEDGKGRKVLEIGCSIGSVAHMLNERGFKVWASDISKYAVERAKKLTPEANFLTFDVQKKIPLKEKFDLIISFEVVEHLEKPEKGIEHMYASLKRGGTIVLSTPYPYSWNYRDPTHINLKYPHEWVMLMEKAGYKDISFHRFTLVPFFYKFHKRLQIIIPFAIPLPYVNSPIFFIGKK
jgi:2-polyprenyl-3-methyl-5-hydroxy-6-metoxy-1,4-benzoquinol methylase